MNAFVRGARVGGGARSDHAFDVDASGLIDAAAMFANPKAHNGDADLLGRGVIAGERYAISGHWRPSRDGRRVLRLRFTRLQPPSPRTSP